MPPLAVVVITHTTRHLRRTLLGVASSSRKPDLTVVSFDGDAADLESCARDAGIEFGLELILVLRPHTGQARPGQVRNNGAQAVIDAGLPDETRLVFFDGDCCPARDCLAAHESIAAGGGAVSAFCIYLTPEQTEAFDENAVRRGDPPAPIGEDQWTTLRQRHARYDWAIFWRRFGLAKSHKPKIASGNFSVPLGAFRAVNGFDTQYNGWGAEDDDIGRRLYASGVRPVNGVAKAITYHLWHPTRRPGAWHDNAGAPRFAMKLPVRCERGLVKPLDQSAPRVLRLPGTPNHASV